MALGKATVNIVANLKPLKRGLAQARGAITSMVKRAGSALRTGFNVGFRVISSGLARITRLAKLTALAILGIGIASVKIASDVIETDNLFEIAMGNMTTSAQKWSTEYSKSLGLFENDTRKALSTFQLMLTSMGVTEKEAFKMSKGLVMLTNDISSLRNQKPEEIFLKLQAGITGEAEPLKRIGILVNDSIIKQLALKDATIQARIANKKGRAELTRIGNLYVKVNKNIKGQGQELTEVEKVTLRYKAIVNATGRDVDDMARTLDDTANVFRVITAQIKTSGNTIGKVFIPAVTKAGIAVRNWLINNQPVIEKWATTVSASIGKVVTKLKEYFALAKAGNFEAIFTDLGKIFKKIIEGLKEAFGAIRPKAVEIGEAIAEGFIAAVKKTEIGEAIGTFKAPKQAVEAIRGRNRVESEARSVERRIGTIMERRSGGVTGQSVGRPSVTVESMLNTLLGPQGSRLVGSEPETKLTEAIKELNMTLRSQDRDIQGAF
jgi:hypothetical protein